VQTAKQASDFSNNPNRNRKLLSTKIKAANRRQANPKPRPQPAPSTRVIQTPAAAQASWDHIPKLISVDSRLWVDSLVRQIWDACKAPSQKEGVSTRKQKLVVQDFEHFLKTKSACMQ
jgi:hypothetical protein